MKNERLINLQRKKEEQPQGLMDLMLSPKQEKVSSDEVIYSSRQNALSPKGNQNQEEEEGQLCLIPQSSLQQESEDRKTGCFIKSEHYEDKEMVIKFESSDLDDDMSKYEETIQSDNSEEEEKDNNQKIKRASFSDVKENINSEVDGKTITQIETTEKRQEASEKVLKPNKKGKLEKKKTFNREDQRGGQSLRRKSKRIQGHFFGREEKEERRNDKKSESEGIQNEEGIFPLEDSIWKTFFNCFPEGVVFIDTSMTVTYANESVQKFFSSSDSKEIAERLYSLPNDLSITELSKQKSQNAQTFLMQSIARTDQPILNSQNEQVFNSAPSRLFKNNLSSNFGNGQLEKQNSSQNISFFNRGNSQFSSNAITSLNPSQFQQNQPSLQQQSVNSQVQSSGIFCNHYPVQEKSSHFQLERKQSFQSNLHLEIDLIFAEALQYLKLHPVKSDSILDKVFSFSARIKKNYPSNFNVDAHTSRSRTQLNLKERGNSVYLAHEESIRIRNGSVQVSQTSQKKNTTGSSPTANQNMFMRLNSSRFPSGLFYMKKLSSNQITEEVICTQPLRNQEIKLNDVGNISPLCCLIDEKKPDQLISNDLNEISQKSKTSFLQIPVILPSLTSPPSLLRAHKTASKDSNNELINNRTSILNHFSNQRDGSALNLGEQARSPRTGEGTQTTLNLNLSRVNSFQIQVPPPEEVPKKKTISTIRGVDKELELDEDGNEITKGVKELDINIFTYVLSGSPVILLLVRDVTHRSYIKLLQDVSKKKSKMVSFVSHELRTPLNSIIAMLETMKQKPQMDYIETALMNSKYLLSISNDLLDLAQIKVNKFHIRKKAFNLKELILETMEMFSIQAERQTIELLVDYHPNIPLFITSDKNRIRQVLINLLSNAFKFTLNGSITIKVTCIAPALLQLSISDTGIGIKESDLNKLFKTFGKLDAEESVKLNEQGKQVIKKLKGHISQNL